MSSQFHDASPKSLARTAGVLYLIIIVFAGFSEGAMRAGLIVPGDGAATVENIGGALSFYRLGIVTDLIAFISDAVVSVLFYVLLRPVHRSLALVAASLRLLAHPAIAAVNLLNELIVLPLLGSATAAGSFDAVQLQTLVMVFLDAHHFGYLIAGAFFGVHCLLLGYLLVKSDRFPAWLGYLLALAALGYLAESFGTILLPQFEEVFAWVVAPPAVVAELSLCLYLLIKGVRSEAAAAPAG
ncbi:DUF4386 domain-containing protein [bacterium]|nr:DUF4386 domain-containing protein [bacterium]